MVEDAHAQAHACIPEEMLRGRRQEAGLLDQSLLLDRVAEHV